MLSSKEEAFVQYWETHRTAHSNFGSKMLRGLPMAFIFSVPILLLIVAVYLYLPEWYTKISNRLSGSIITIVLAVVICIIFFSYFRMHFKWEMNEQLYQELLQKQKKGEAAKS
ncbi:MAG: hypothetical protein EOO03_10455 [Chitinophagaceae bacterium]|nr:MAG: hypothetical protein EOO03_10455 [Chitinophagaceae bacterium]